MEWDLVTDFVSVGSGGGGLVGAVTAAANGCETLVIEKQPVLGGSTAMSGGVIWIPNNPLMAEGGIEDSYEDAMSYFAHVVGEVGPGSSYERRHAYVTQGPKMVSFLRDQGVRFLRCDRRADYYPNVKGARDHGRSIECELFDATLLGPWVEHLQRGAFWNALGLAGYSDEMTALVNFNRSAGSLATAARAWARTKSALARNQVPTTQGWSYIGQLLRVALRNETTFWRETPFEDLVVEGGRVVGIVARHNNRSVRIAANKGVLLASGGFSHNAEMRQKYLDPAGSPDRSHANAGDNGDGIASAMSHGAATDMMDGAIWVPAKLIGGTFASDMDRQRPGTIFVDSSGSRFCNEGNSYVEVGWAQLERNQTVPAVPAWIIFDDGFRRRYAFKKGRPGVIPQDWLDRNDIVKAESIEELASQCGIDPTGLRSTLDRFNPNAGRGIDPEFHRGEGALNHVLGDPRWKPNNCLAPIAKAPFYAAAIYPADVGTSGGLVTDDRARVLDTSGDPISGLYATGNTTATVMGRAYLGAGSSIGNTSIFGYIAALHASGATVE